MELDQLQITAQHIMVKFRKTPRFSSISNDDFTLNEVTAGGLVPVSSPFKPIELDIHYDSVSRLLYLYFSSPITQAGVTYQFVIDGIHSPIGTHMGTYTAYFALEQKGEEPPDNEPVHIIQADSSVPSAPEPVEPVEVTDFSIVRSAFISSETLSPPNQGFFIKKSDPANNDLFIDSDHNNGRITITFTERPALQYITNAYIKLQRKKLATPGRWEDLSADIHLDSDFPIVYVDSPSLESTPQYNQSGSDYFADNYKYRVRLSKDIAMYPPVISE